MSSGVDTPCPPSGAFMHPPMGFVKINTDEMVVMMRLLLFVGTMEGFSLALLASLSGLCQITKQVVDDLYEHNFHVASDCKIVVNDVTDVWNDHA